MKKKRKLFSILLASSILLSNISPIITYATDLPNVSTKETSSESSDLLTSESSSVENPKESTVETTNSSVESTATTSEETQHSEENTTQSTTETTTESSEEAPAEDGHDSTVSSAGNQISAASLEKTVDIASFVEQYSDTVINIATPNNLYPSVMMAQGILESAAGTSELAKKANNLFGMKFKEKEDEGKYDYVLHDSYEYINGEAVLVTSKFRKYASCYDSFKDNALKMKTGTPDFPNRYENVWRDHTNSYLDATQGLVTGGYATSPDYAKQLNSLIETWHLQKLDQGTKFMIDSVGTNNRVFGKDFQVKGWLLSPYKVKNIQVISNGKVIASGNIGISRPDVQGAYPLYNQANAGFAISVPTASVPVGNSKITIQYELSSGEKVSQVSSITRADEKPKLYVDSPYNGQILTNSQKISGWATSLSGTQSVSATINGKTYNIENINISRPDVSAKYPEYNTDKVGFSFNLDTLNLPLNKTYSLVITVKTKAGETINQTLQVKKTGLDLIYSVDTLFEGETYYNTVNNLHGWAMANVPISGIDVSVDGKIVQSNVKVDRERLDVYSKYTAYNNKNSGYNTNLDFSNLSSGKHTVVLTIKFTDGTTHKVTRNINIEKLSDRFYLDTLSATTNNVYGNYRIGGWALGANSPFKKVEATINGKTTSYDISIARDDVHQAFPAYGQKNSGFSFYLDTKTLPFDKNQTLTLKFIKENGSSTTKNYTVIKKSQTLKGYIDNLASGTNLAKDYNVHGWAIGNAELTKFEILNNGQNVAKNVTFTQREDVKSAFPQYVYGSKGNGYNATIDWAKLAGGNQTLNFVATFADGKKVTNSVSVKVDKLEDKYSIDAPLTTVSGNTLNIRGWFLSSKAVTSITGKIKETTAVPTTTLTSGLSRPDVYQTYPQYQEKNPGFNGNLNITKLVSGSYTLVLTVKKKDGTTFTVERKITVEKQPLRYSIDTPENGKHIYTGDLKVDGWFLADEGLKEVNYTVNGEKVGTTTTFTTRSDVNSVYPEYGSMSSGYIFTIPNKYFIAGPNQVKITFISKTGRQTSETRTIYNNWTIVIDPGHGGIDSGAVGFGLCEKDINLAIALRLEEKLKAEGYTVLMTRRTDIYLGPNGGTLEDLATRAALANDNNADLFVSIHQNSGVFTAKGIETYYQEAASAPSNNGVDQKWRIAESGELAFDVQKNLINQTGFYDRGVKNANFHVIRQTKMPAILVEGGFISNQSDAANMGTATHQNRMAEAIRLGVNTYIANN